jgi:acetate kinase
VFDTSFQQTMPEKAYMFGIPYEYYEKYSLRRYGFHGTSHRYVSARYFALTGKDPAGTKIITCHLGNGSSITAIKNGEVIDTSMGFTPLEGIMMGTRCGSMDPAIVPFIMEKEGFTPKEMNEFMNKKCGVLGVSEISSDLRDIEAALLHNDEMAMRACKILSYGIKKYIGSYTAAMNGLDAIVFTAGIGENNGAMRERVCKDMEFYGIEFDKEANDKAFKPQGPMEISAPGSKTKVYVIPTNEELMIARETEKIVSARK